MIKYGGALHGFLFGAGFEIVRRVLVPVIFVLIALGLWWWLGPEKPQCDYARKSVARVAVARVAERIRAERGDVRSACVMHFANDPTDFVTLTLRKRLSDGGIFDLQGTPPMEKIRSLLNFRNRGSCDEEEALEYARRKGLDAVVIGNVDRFEAVNGKASISGAVKFIKTATGETIEIQLADGRIPDVDDQISSNRSPAAVQPVDTIRETPLAIRILIASACIFAIPILFFPFLKLVMVKNSNLATGIVLLALLAADGVVVHYMLCTTGAFADLALFLVFLAAGFGYDLYMLSFAQLCRPALPGES